MKVKNIVFSGVMATILGATSANAAAISVASQGYVDSKVTKLENAIDVANAYYDSKIEALEDADATFATKAYVGTIPSTAEADDIVAYVQEKTAGIATEGALTELGGRVKQVEDSLKEGGDTANAIAAALAAGQNAQSEVDALKTVVGNKANAADVYSKTEIDTTVATLATKEALNGVSEIAEEQASAAQEAAEATAASELASAMQSIATAYLAKPAECATTYCVLSVTDDTVSWMPLTEPQSEYYPLPE